MTIVYYVRHAEPNYENHIDELRELSEEGLRDRCFVKKYLKDRDIQAIFSSPYKRAVDTVFPFAEEAGIPIQVDYDLRERKVGTDWIDDFNSFAKKQWEDFNYKLLEGESLSEVQNRNIKVIEKLLQLYENQNLVIAGHGTALSTIINYYDSTFGYEGFNGIKNKMPLIVKFTFDKSVCCNYEIVELVNKID